MPYHKGRFYASEPKMKGGAIAKSILQEMAVSAYPGHTKLNIGNFSLFYSTPTLKFYREGNLIVVAIRGTQLNDKNDLAADVASVVGRVRNTERYRKDKATMELVQSKYPPPQFRYIAVGHSIGGAILDLFLRDRLIQNGISYNPAVEPHELGGSPLHYRIYHKDDPLYKIYGHKIPNIEVRSTKDPIWKYFLKQVLPFPFSQLFHSYDSHTLGMFKGGAKSSTFEKQLESVGMSPEEYLEQVRKNAERCGYDPDAVEFSDNKTHKIQIKTPDGIVRFGRVGYNDFQIWSHLERNKEVPSGTAEGKRKRFWKSHSKMGGNWKDNDYSPNWLALRLLW